MYLTSCSLPSLISWFSIWIVTRFSSWFIFSDEYFPNTVPLSALPWMAMQVAASYLLRQTRLQRSSYMSSLAYASEADSSSGLCPGCSLCLEWTPPYLYLRKLHPSPSAPLRCRFSQAFLFTRSKQYRPAILLQLSVCISSKTPSHRTLSCSCLGTFLTS